MALSVRPWFRWHWLTWLVGATVVGGLLARQFEKQVVLEVRDLSIQSEWSDFGWPLTYLHLIDTLELRGGGMFERRFDYDWHFERIFLNGLFGALLTAGAAFAAERWLGSERRLQFSIVGILSATAMTGGLIALSYEWKLRDFDSETANVYWSLVSIRDLRHPLRWPSLVALALTLYLTASLLLRVAFWQVGLRLGR